jgi:transcriptional regulator with XRE-family HTH domain
MNTDQPDPPKTTPSTTVNREVLETRRKNMGLTSAALAEKAKVSLRTIVRARTGKPIRLDSAQLIANALEVSLHTLINGWDPPVRPDAAPRHTVGMRLNVPHEEMLHPRRSHKTIRLLKRVIGTDAEMKFSRVTNGNKTNVELPLRDSDVLRLIAAMLDGDLDDIEIEELWIDDHSWIIQILALLEYHGKTDGRDAETWDELLNSGALEFLKIRTRDCLFCRLNTSAPQ